MSLQSWMTRKLDRWAIQHVVRVALFGQGLVVSEWYGLTTSIYSQISPQVNIVDDPFEADVLAIHGPITDLSWIKLKDWLASSRSGTLKIAIGHEVSVNESGYLLSPNGDESDILIDIHVPGFISHPQILHQALRAGVLNV
jgi:Ni,Fe-hydrogenase III small subunit